MSNVISRIRVFLYMLKQGVKSIFQNLFMIFASVSVIFASLLIIGTLLSVAENVQTVIDHYNDRPQIRVNFKSHVDEETCLAVRDELLQNPTVESVEYISAEENLQGILDTFEEDGKADLFQGYESNDELKFVSLDISLKNASDGEEFEAQLYEDVEGIESVRNILDIVNKLQTVKVIIRTCSLIAILVMGCVSVLLVFNTVKLTVFARKREIEIMKYIGATDVFIVGPFIIEGFFVGLTGGLLSYGVLKGVYSLVYNYFTDKNVLGDSIKFIAFGDLGFNFMLWFVVAGIVVGVAAGALAVKRHVKV